MSTDDASDPPRYFYTVEGGRFVPGPLVAGPWNPAHQGGVPLAGLCAYLIERTPTAEPMVTARVVIDLLRPTPMETVEGRVTITRDGRRLQMVEVEIIAGGVVTVRASALRVRSGDTPESPDVQAPDAPPAEAQSFLPIRASIRHLMETRLLDGGLEHMGPGTVWVRIAGEIVRGVPITSFVQMVMAADFGSGLSAFVDWRDWSFANVDITLHLARMPVGPWLKLGASTLSAGNGLAVVNGTLADGQGPVGRTHQTLYLERRQA